MESEYDQRSGPDEARDDLSRATPLVSSLHVVTGRGYGQFHVFFTPLKFFVTFFILALTMPA
jgi:hypothetical protein